MTKSNLTNDELQSDIQAGLLEAESRMADAGLARLLKRFRRAHAVISDVEEDLHDQGQISARSGGGKPD